MRVAKPTNKYPYSLGHGEMTKKNNQYVWVREGGSVQEVWLYCFWFYFILVDVCMYVTRQFYSDKLKMVNLWVWRSQTMFKFNDGNSIYRWINKFGQFYFLLDITFFLPRLLLFLYTVFFGCCCSWKKK